MTLIADILIGLVAGLHIYFLVLEMFFWNKPMGLRVFGHAQAQADASKLLAMNQGLYNGFLAAGLIWGLALGGEGFSIKIFFLACVITAGIVGALTVSPTIFFVQALPAAI